MSLFLRLAWRNVWRHRRRTLIVVTAIALGFMLMMLYDGLVAGFEQAIYGNAVQVLGGNIQLHAAGYSEQTRQNPLLPLPNAAQIVDAARQQPQVVAAGQRIKTGGMVTSPEGAFGVSIVGVEPQVEQAYALEPNRISAGRYLQPGDRDQAVLGRALAASMGVAVGDRFTLVGRAANDQMRQRTMTVAGIYDIGMPEIEKRTLYIALGEAQDLYGLPGQSTEVAVVLQRIGEEPAVIAAIQPALNGAEVQTWSTLFPELLAALTTKGKVMDIFSVLILVIAGIGILNMLLMAIYERTREIGVLGAMGMKPRQIGLLFLLEGGLMGLVGLAAGVVIGLVFNLLLGRVGLDFSAYSSITSYSALLSTRVYPTLGLEKFGLRALTVLVVALLCSILPAREAAQHEPARALHFV